ncbi:putative glycosyltransferase [Thioploca ingrica]|uniref:Putative glycosyltransferase n=1 Tax=Thioploca ingrica TaxID=40754 RepID=A0A090ADS9_9GAMM|nr:putative glycosyltransferase [Thioploca ingrica]
MQIIVLGMHRSGTSMVARLLNMMGAYFATEATAMFPTAANPKGYWEREDIRQLNDQVIQSLGMSWDNISDFDSPLLTEELQQRIRHSAQKIIFSLETRRPWMIKDPRLCLLLPLWKPLLEIPVCVYVYRSPIQVAQSLKTREGFPLILGMALWEKYNSYGLAHCADMPRILVSHQELVTQPVNTVKKLHQDLLDCEVQGLRLPADKEIRAFIEPQLFREQGDIQLQSGYINQQQQRLLEAFENGLIFQLSQFPSLSAGTIEILQEYKNKLVANQQNGWLQQEIGKRNQEIVELNQRTTQLNFELTKQQEVIDQCDQEIAQRNQVIDQCNQVITQRNQVISQRDQEIKQVLQTKALEIKSYKNQLVVAENQTNKLNQTVNELKRHQQQLQTHLTVIQTTLSQTQTTLTEKAQQLAEVTRKSDQQQHDIHLLQHWLKALADDIKAVFASLTWRSGHWLTQLALKLLWRKPDLTAQDHINNLLREISLWEHTSKNITSPSSSLPAKTALTPAPSESATTLALAPPRFALLTNPRDYPRWIKNYDTLTTKIIKRMQQRIAEWEYRPFISIVMPTYNTPEQWLRLALESVLEQIYPHWELCIVDDASTQPQVRRLLEEYAQRDNRIKLKFRTENGHISAASNTALEMISGEFVAFLDHDDKLARQALFWVAKDILDYPDAMLWYSDEDKINEQEERLDPYFKSDWNPDLFLSHNLITHLAVYRMTLIQQLIGFRESYEGAQDYDLALRAIEQINPVQIRHIPRVLYHWRIITGSTASRPEEKPYALIAAQQAIKEYLARRGIIAQVMESPEVRGTIRVQYPLPEPLPLVTLIIPTYNGLELLQRCVESILTKTTYENFEILIINNNSDDPSTLAYLHQLENNGQAHVLDYPYPFNYADMNNMAVEHAQGELIGLLNNDLEVINPEWLAEMVSHAVRPEVGVVGARLWYPNDTLQHGGVILGIGGVAGHAHKGFPRGNVGYLGRASLIQNFSAVTGACMIMRKSNFLKVGGLNAEHLAIAFNDVELCLKMNEHNLRIVWTPYAELYHHESASRGYEDTPEKLARFETERAYMKSRWPNFLLMDPAYSPNLTLETQDFALAWPPRVSILP